MGDTVSLEEMAALYAHVLHGAFFDSLHLWRYPMNELNPVEKKLADAVHTAILYLTRARATRWEYMQLMNTLRMAAAAAQRKISGCPQGLHFDCCTCTDSMSGRNIKWLKQQRMKTIKGTLALVLVGFMVARVWAGCNSTGFSCSADINCPSAGTVYTGTYYYKCGTGFCEPSTCHWHDPTYGCPYTQVWAGTCGITGCNNIFSVSPLGCGTCGSGGDCVNTISNCTIGTCPVWTGWINQGCAINGCAAGQMSQTSSGSGAPCCGPSTKHQCVADVTDCTAPIITAFTANPLTVTLGDSVAFIWALAGGIPTSETMDQGIGPVTGTTYTGPTATVGVVPYTLTVTNAIGSASASVNMTVNPPPPHCAPGTICGDLHAAEQNTLAIPNWPVYLYDQSGNPKQNIRTDGAGHFVFPALTPTAYIVKVGTGRNMATNPAQQGMQPANIVSNGAVTIRGVPALITVTGEPGTFVLITTSAYAGGGPPPLDSIGSLIIYDATIGTDFKTPVTHVRGGNAYSYVCWKVQSSGSFQRTLSQPINAGNPVWPMDQFMAACP